MAEINYLDELDKESQKIIAMVGEEARNRHGKAYLIGGIVRDLILKRKNFDLDIVVEGDALQLAEAVGKPLKMELTVHEAFQTCSLRAHGSRIDFATARREMYPKPGALPVVETAHLDADIFRRDFTVNGLAISINPGSWGKLIDLYGGLADLEKGIIRVFHENSFVDDPTRVLRAVRFEQRFQFEIEQATRHLLTEAIREKRNESVKAPRYFNEFKKILLEEDPIPGLKRLKELGGINFWKAALKVEPKSLNVLRQRLNEAKRKNLLPDPGNGWLVYLMALMEDLDKRRIMNILRKIQIKNEFVDAIIRMKDRTGIYKELNRKELSDSRVYRTLQVHAPETLVYFLGRSPNALVRRRIAHYLGKTKDVRLKISGDDIKSLGVREGKRIGMILKKTLDEKIDRMLTTRDQELKVAKDLLGLS